MRLADLLPGRRDAEQLAAGDGRGEDPLHHHDLAFGGDPGDVELGVGEQVLEGLRHLLGVGQAAVGAFGRIGSVVPVVLGEPPEEVRRELLALHVGLLAEVTSPVLDGLVLAPLGHFMLCYFTTCHDGCSLSRVFLALSAVSPYHRAATSTVKIRAIAAPCDGMYSPDVTLIRSYRYMDSGWLCALDRNAASVKSVAATMNSWIQTASTDGRISGNTTRRKVASRLAPDEAAASSSSRPTWRMALCAVR